jgi:hypothetical protein
LFGAQEARALTIQKYLKQALWLDKLLNAHLEQLRRLHEKKTSISQALSLTKVQTSSHADKTADLAAQFADLEELIKQDYNNLLHVKRDIRAMINTLSEPAQKLIMIERYINLKHWEVIAADNHYSWKTVHRIHANALKIICKKNPDVNPPV